jgi:hypothetical protein
VKALSVKQPWANLIASGKKTMETRTWGTTYRGELLIVSSKKPVIAPAGFALALVNLVECRPMTLSDERFACCEIYDRAVVWILDNIRAIKPFPLIGQLGIFDVNVERESIRLASSSR